MPFSYTIVSDFRAYEKFPYDYILRDRNINSFGYYTYFLLYRVEKDKDNTPLVLLQFINPNQQKIDKFDDKAPFISFIKDEEWGERFRSRTSDEERKALCKLFNISFCADGYSESNIFQDAILGRNLSLSQWTFLQHKIKRIVL